MSDDEALLRAICERPEEDIPRLMYADFLDETGEADRAAFIRAQVEAARLPPWEPFAVYCRHQKPVWTHGRPWASTLPDFPRGWNVEWGDPPFRRGFGWRVAVRSLFSWQKVSPKLFETNPIGELHLTPSATLDDWRRFANADWVRKLRVLKLDGSNLSEPLRALRESRIPMAIEDVHLLRASGEGIGFIVSDLLNSRLGETIRALSFRTGYAALEDLIDALTQDGQCLERLRLAAMGITSRHIERFCERGGCLRLSEVDLPENRLTDGLSTLAAGLQDSSLTTLGLSKVDVFAESRQFETLTACEPLTTLRSLDLSRNPSSPRAMRQLSLSKSLANIRSLNLSRCVIGDKGIRHLIHAKFWPNLVELDLRENPIAGVGAKHFLDAEVPRDLTALLLNGTNLGVDVRNELRRKFGDAVIFSSGQERG